MLAEQVSIPQQGSIFQFSRFSQLDQDRRRFGFWSDDQSGVKNQPCPACTFEIWELHHLDSGFPELQRTLHVLPCHLRYSLVLRQRPRTLH